MGHASTAMRVREAKERKPEDFCKVPACLWRIRTAQGANPCRKHPVAPVPATEPRQTTFGVLDVSR